MEPTLFNLLSELPPAREAEVSELLLGAKGVRMDRPPAATQSHDPHANRTILS